MEKIVVEKAKQSYFQEQLEIPREVREYVLDRDGKLCFNEWCKNRYECLTIHHIVPRSLGGSGTDPCNLVVLCGFCHMDIGKMKRFYPELQASHMKELIHRYPVNFYDHEFEENFIKCFHENLF